MSGQSPGEGIEVEAQRRRRREPRAEVGWRTLRRYMLPEPERVVETLIWNESAEAGCLLCEKTTGLARAGPSQEAETSGARGAA